MTYYLNFIIFLWNNVILGEPINHATAYGRIAFSVPTADLESYQENAKNNQYKILTPFVTLDTPGKASVSVVIFADPVRFNDLCLL